MAFSSKQIIFLINPNSGRGKYQKTLAALKNADSRIHYYISKSKEDLKLFFDTLDKQFKVVVICGGDGTVNSLLKYAINSDLIFAVLPNGSGNGFAREMGYCKNIEKMLKQIKRGNTRKIDVVKVNDNYCCNIAGIGFDSYIAQLFDRNGKRGLVTYVYESLNGFFKYPFIQAKIVADNIQLEGDYFMLIMANTRQFGNNVIIAPNALPDDGLLDLVAIKRFPKRVTPLVIIKLLSKKGKDSKYIQYLRAREITIKTDYEDYHVDGEPLKQVDTIISAKIETTINVINSNL